MLTRNLRKHGFLPGGSSGSPGSPIVACTGGPAAGSDCGGRSPAGFGTMRLTTIGRRTGRARPVIVGYVADGPNLVTLAMNG